MTYGWRSGAFLAGCHASESPLGSVTADARDRTDNAGRDRVEIILPNGRRLVTPASTETPILARLIQVVERA